METKQKRTIIVSVVVLAGLLVFSLLGIAADSSSRPRRPPYRIIVEALDKIEPRIPIGPDTTPGDANCTFKITEPGSYYLTSNFTSNFKHGILVDANNVTIDLMGYEIRSSWSSAPPGAKMDFHGIYSENRRNIEIRNGTIVSNNGFLHGIWAYGNIPVAYSDYNRVIDVRVIGSRGNGIMLEGSSRVTGCTVAENGSGGIWLPVRGNIVIGNLVCNNAGVGVHLQGDSLVDQNTVYNNTSGNITTSGSCTFGVNHAP